MRPITITIAIAAAKLELAQQFQNQSSNDSMIIPTALQVLTRIMTTKALII